MKTLGRHLITEFYHCDSAVLDDLESVRAAMLAAGEAVGVTLVGERFHRYAPQGVSGVLLIAESHLSVHTWPEARYAAVDIYTCGGLQPQLGYQVLSEAFGASDGRMQEIVRGLPDELDAGRPIGPEDVAVVSGAVQRW